MVDNVTSWFRLTEMIEIWDLNNLFADFNSFFFWIIDDWTWAWNVTALPLWVDSFEDHSLTFRSDGRILKPIDNSVHADRLN